MTEVHPGNYVFNDYMQVLIGKSFSCLAHYQLVFNLFIFKAHLMQQNDKNIVKTLQKPFLAQCELLVRTFIPAHNVCSVDLCCILKGLATTKT